MGGDCRARYAGSNLLIWIMPSWVLTGTLRVELDQIRGYLIMLFWHLQMSEPVTEGR